MPKKVENCRTCVHAQWIANANGRRNFDYRALCIAPVDVSLLPLSAWEAARILETKSRVVIEHGKNPLSVVCNLWVKI